MGYGRIVDIRRDDALGGENQEVIVAVGDHLSAYRLRSDTPVDAGDLIEFEVRGEEMVSVARLGGVQEGEWRSDGDAMRWRRPHQRPSRMRLLWERQKIVQAVRRYLYGEAFLEVPGPALVRAACPDAALGVLRCGDLYLTTSTEYQIKRLIAGGFERVFTLAQNFRAKESGRHHNPEFTMLEWARAFTDLAAIERDAEHLIQDAFAAVHPQEDSVSVGGNAIRIRGAPWERATVREVLLNELGVEIAPDFSLESMQSETRRKGVPVAESCMNDSVMLFSSLMERVQASLGRHVPVFVREWPAFLTSSAASLADHPSVTERCEIFIGGVEVGDGFASLQEYRLQRASFEREISRRRALGIDEVALDHRYLEAVRLGLPPGAGMALGLDRLALVLLSQDDIRDVLPFAWDEL